LSLVFLSHPIYNSETGITDWSIHPVVGLASLVIIATVLVPSVVFFFWQGKKSKDKIVKTRSLLISVGLLFLTITAYTYYTVTTQIGSLVSDLLSLASFIIIFVGVVYKRGEN